MEYFNDRLKVEIGGLKFDKEAKMDGMESEMDGLKTNMEFLKEVLTKVLKERLPGGDKVIHENHD